MFIFGHIGITLGAAVLVSGLVTTARRAYKKDNNSMPTQTKSLKSAPLREKSSLIRSWFESLGGFLDIRILIIGSLLPDIIDKPFGFYLLGNGRIITHTLLVTLVVTIIGICLYMMKKKTWLLALAIGMISHLILDGMWLNPQVFLWPLHGWTFAKLKPTNWIARWLSVLRGDYRVYIPEVAGLVVVIVFLWLQVKQKRLTTFLASGNMREKKD